MLTNNLAKQQFEKHIKVFDGEDRYMSSGTPKVRVSEDENMSHECRDSDGSEIKRIA